MSLTRKQLMAYDFIAAYHDKREIAPSYDELKKALKIKSKSGVHRLITGLEERGYIARIPYRARALTITRNRDGVVLPGYTPPPVIATMEARAVLDEFSSSFVAVVYHHWTHFTPQERHRLSGAWCFCSNEYYNGHKAVLSLNLIR